MPKIPLLRWRRLVPPEPAMPKATHLLTCTPCERYSHERCVGCTGCGCVPSAQYAAATQGPHRVPAMP